MKNLMKLISVIFHPLLVVPYISVLLALFLPQAYAVISPEVMWRVVIMLVLLTSLFPSLFVLGLWMFTPWVSDLELSERKERILPFMVLIVFYGVAAKFLVIDLNLGYMVKTLMVSAVVMVLIMVLITLKFKISIHTAAIWSLAGTCIGLALKFPESAFDQIGLAAIISGGLIGTSRLYLGYHRPVEVWVGSIYGFAFGCLAVLFLI